MEVERQKPKKRWVEVENFPTAAQKAFGPGTPKDQEKCGRLLHGCHVNLNIKLSDANLCENVVSLAENPSRICVRRHKKFECTNVDVCAKGPEVRFLEVIDTLKLLDPLVAFRKGMVQRRRCPLHQDPNGFPEQRNHTNSYEKRDEHGADGVGDHQVVFLH